MDESWSKRNLSNMSRRAFGSLWDNNSNSNSNSNSKSKSNSNNNSNSNTTQ